MAKQQDHETPMTNKIIWDCDSALYDSFELRSFKRQLEAAIVSRTFSMPRLSDPVQPPVQPTTTKKQSRLARTLNKLLRSVFRRKISSSMHLQAEYWHKEDGFSGAYSLSTIPEVCEKAFASPEFDPVVRKTASERFTSTTGRGLLKVPAST